MDSAKDLYQKYHEHKKVQPEIFENNMIRNLETLRKSINNYNSYGLNNKNGSQKVVSQSVIWLVAVYDCSISVILVNSS